MISMGFTESTNEKEIKHLIASLETIISEEMKLLKERESMSDTWITHKFIVPPATEMATKFDHRVAMNLRW